MMVESLCAMTISVLPFVSSSMERCNLSSFSGSVKAVASSKITIGAFLSIALAIAIRWRSPPESLAPASPAFVSYPSGNLAINSSHPACAAAHSTSLSVASGFPIRILSRRLMWNRKLSWDTKLIFSVKSERESSRISVPPTRTAPASTSQKRATSLASVDLPEPEGPTNAVTVPAFAAKETPRMTSLSPYPK